MNSRQRIKYWALIIAVNIGVFFVLDHALDALLPAPQIPNIGRTPTSFQDETIYSRSKRSGAPLPGEGVKVMVVGDSFTVGRGVERPFPQVIEDELLMGGGDAASFNFGEDGATVKEVYRKLQTHVKELRPDVVVYALVLNDIIHHGGSGITLFPGLDVASEKGGVPWDFFNLNPQLVEEYFSPTERVFARISRLAYRIAFNRTLAEISEQVVRSYQELLDPTVNSQGFKETLAVVEEMQKTAAEVDAHLLVVIWPFLYSTEENYPFLEGHTSITTALRERDIAVFDLLPLFRGMDARSLWLYPLDQHPNARAHEMAGRAVAAEIREIVR